MLLAVHLLVHFTGSAIVAGPQDLCGCAHIIQSARWNASYNTVIPISAHGHDRQAFRWTCATTRDSSALQRGCMNTHVTHRQGCKAQRLASWVRSVLKASLYMMLVSKGVLTVSVKTFVYYCSKLPSSWLLQTLRVLCTNASCNDTPQATIRPAVQVAQWTSSCRCIHAEK